MTAAEERKRAAENWFRSLRDELCAAFEKLEDDAAPDSAPGRFVRTAWERPGGGGGAMSIMRGGVVEKV